MSFFGGQHINMRPDYSVGSCLPISDIPSLSSDAPMLPFGYARAFKQAPRGRGKDGVGEGAWNKWRQVSDVKKPNHLKAKKMNIKRNV